MNRWNSFMYFPVSSFSSASCGGAATPVETQAPPPVETEAPLVEMTEEPAAEMTEEPVDEVLQRLQFIRLVGEAESLYQRLWDEVKSAP